MDDVVRRALKASNDRLARIRGGTVTYRPFGGDDYTVFASPAGNRTLSMDHDGFVHDAVYQDFIVAVSEMSATPRRNDKIIDGDKVWRVHQPSGEREYSYHDPYNDSYRIHCVLDDDNHSEIPQEGNPFTSSSGAIFDNLNDDPYEAPEE